MIKWSFTLAVLPALGNDGLRDNPRDLHSDRVHAARQLASLITQRVPNQGPSAARSAADLYGSRAACITARAAPNRGFCAGLPRAETGVTPGRIFTGGVCGTLLSGHGLPSARFPWRVPPAGRASGACMGPEFSESHTRVFQRSRSV